MAIQIWIGLFRGAAVFAHARARNITRFATILILSPKHSAKIIATHISLLQISVYNAPTTRVQNTITGTVPVKII